MKQMSLGSGGFERYGKTTKRAAFLAEMDKVVPWSQLCALIEPHYPKPGRGRPPVPLQRMLHIHFLQHWFNLSDPGVEEALYESQSMREFVGIDPGSEAAPDETTVCKFRHLLERHGLGEQIFKGVAEPLQTQGFRVATSGNVADSTVLPQLLHGQERAVWGDSAHSGQGKVIEERAPWAVDLTQYRARGVPVPQRGAARDQPQVFQGSLPGGAHHRRHQARVRFRQGALPRPGQERQPLVRGRRAGQPVHRAAAIDAAFNEVVRARGAAAPCWAVTEPASPPVVVLNEQPSAQNRP